jgi:membrane-bound lytic murein transglycosylase D
MNRTLLVLLIGVLAAAAAHAKPSDFPRPAALEPDVSFWKRIYGEVGTDGGLIHDTRDLRVVYEVVKLPSGISGRARERHTDKLKERYKSILRTLSKGKRSGLSREEQRVLSLFGPNVSNSTLRDSMSRIRFQLGQANKFRAGVIRSGTYKPHILDVLKDMDLPLEIANLPHVESSYTPTVYSRVGAAGLWQFTRSTGRRFMQIDHIVDERLDPYLASVAAARLLEQNRRVTGSWPLAITAYNHGAAGMRRAARKLGTRDIVKVVRKYRSRTFGFASRNFYVEFLAANEVASNPEYYFGPVAYDRPIAFETVELPFYGKPAELARAIGVDLETLKAANPGLRTSVWNGSKYIPKGYDLRIPRSSLSQPLSKGVASVPKPQRHARQTRDASYTVRRGDTLSTIARRHGVRMSQLASLNGLKSKNRIRIGQKLRLPSDSKANIQVAHKPNPETKTKATSKSKPKAAKPGRPAELPEGGIYRVRRGDNLTEIADRFGLSVSELVSINGLRSRHRIAIGQKLLVTNAAPVPKTKSSTSTASLNKSHPDAVAALSPARSADTQPVPSDVAAVVDVPIAVEAGDTPSGQESNASDESAVEPSPGLLADPSDYTVASSGTILVQPNETLGHYAEWLGLRASRLRQINNLRYGETVGIHQKLKLDFSSIGPDAFERVRVEYHRALQEEFFAHWEIEGTSLHRVGPGDSLWTLSRQRFDVPIWLLRQYNPDVNLEALSRGTKLTIPKLRQRTEDTSDARTMARSGSAG